MSIESDKARRQARIVADAEKRAAKPYVLSITEQVRALGGKYRAQNVTTIRYASHENLIRGLKRRHGGLAWKKAENGVSFIFANTSDNGSKRLMVNAYRDQSQPVSLDINEMVEERNGLQLSTKQ